MSLHIWWTILACCFAHSWATATHECWQEETSHERCGGYCRDTGCNGHCGGGQNNNCGTGDSSGCWVGSTSRCCAGADTITREAGCECSGFCPDGEQTLGANVQCESETCAETCCTAAPCDIPNSDKKDGTSCACMDGFEGSITWSGSTPSGRCQAAPCDIPNSNKEAGMSCACVDGFEGSITWSGSTPSGSCQGSPCDIPNSNKEAGTSCACLDGFEGSITWSGSTPSGSCQVPTTATTTTTTSANHSEPVDSSSPNLNVSPSDGSSTEEAALGAGVGTELAVVVVCAMLLACCAYIMYKRCKRQYAGKAPALQAAGEAKEAAVQAITLENPTKWQISFFHQTLDGVEEQSARSAEIVFHYTNLSAAQTILSDPNGLKISTGGYCGGGLFFSTDRPTAGEDPGDKRLWREAFPEFRERQLKQNYGDDLTEERKSNVDAVLVCSVASKMLDTVPDRESAKFIGMSKMKTFDQTHLPPKSIIKAYRLKPEVDDTGAATAPNLSKASNGRAGVDTCIGDSMSEVVLSEVV